MAEELDAKKVEALFALQLADQRAKLIDEAQGYFKFKWRLRDYLWGLWLLVSFVGVTPFSNPSNICKYLGMASILLFAAFQLHRISRLECRADAIAKLLLQEGPLHLAHRAYRALPPTGSSYLPQS